MKTIHFLSIGLIGVLIMFSLFLSESELIKNDFVFLPICAITGISMGIGAGRMIIGKD
jgi:hypothetical protein